MPPPPPLRQRPAMFQRLTSGWSLHKAAGTSVVSQNAPAGGWSWRKDKGVHMPHGPESSRNHRRPGPTGRYASGRPRHCQSVRGALTPALVTHQVNCMRFMETHVSARLLWHFCGERAALCADRQTAMRGRRGGSLEDGRRITSAGDQGPVHATTQLVALGASVGTAM